MDGSGGLESFEFCAAIKKLVCVRQRECVSVSVCVYDLLLREAERQRGKERGGRGGRDRGAGRQSHFFQLDPRRTRKKGGT